MNKTPSIIYIWSQRLYITYRWAFHSWNNEHFDGKPWNCREEWFAFIGWNPKLWEIEDMYYDGHTIQSITILGLTIGKGFTYESAAQKDTTRKSPRLTPHSD
jgi:hypothetical protein